MYEDVSIILLRGSLKVRWSWSINCHKSPCKLQCWDLRLNKRLNKTGCLFLDLYLYRCERNHMVCSETGYMLQMIWRKMSQSLVSIRQQDHIELCVHIKRKSNTSIITHPFAWSIHIWVIGVHCMNIDLLWKHGSNEFFCVGRLKNGCWIYRGSSMVSLY